GEEGGGTEEEGHGAPPGGPARGDAPPGVERTLARVRRTHGRRGGGLDGLDRGRGLRGQGRRRRGRGRRKVRSGSRELLARRGRGALLESEDAIEETTDLFLERHDALLAAGRSRAAAHGTEGQDCEEDGD